MNNAYSDLIDLMKEHGATYNPPSITLGEVLDNDPLTVLAGELQLTKEDMYISANLLNTYNRDIKLSISPATGLAGEHNIASIGLDKAKINFTDGLNKGDLLAIMPINDLQKYIVLARVVQP